MAIFLVILSNLIQPFVFFRAWTSRHWSMICIWEPWSLRSEQKVIVGTGKSKWLLNRPGLFVIIEEKTIFVTNKFMLLPCIKIYIDLWKALKGTGLSSDDMLDFPWRPSQKKAISKTKTMTMIVTSTKNLPSSSHDQLWGCCVSVLAFD